MQASGAGEIGTDSARVCYLRVRNNNDDNSRADDGVQNKSRRHRDDGWEVLHAHHLECKWLPSRQLKVQLQAFSCVRYWV
jgi:hypothetical protein